MDYFFRKLSGMKTIQEKAASNKETLEQKEHQTKGKKK